jgi:hypothetical protein
VRSLQYLCNLGVLRIVAGTVSTVVDKAFQLLQACLGRVKLDAFNLRTESLGVLQALLRISQAFAQVWMWVAISPGHKCFHVSL